MSKLRNACGPDSYHLFALSSPDNPKHPLKPKDFLVKTEEHGIPQARHRVFIICLRKDIAENLHPESSPRLTKQDTRVTVNDIISGMPRLRSGLSRDDESTRWLQAIHMGYKLCALHHPILSKSEKNEFRKTLSAARKIANFPCPPEREMDGGVTIPDSCPDDLRNWLQDKALERLPNNHTRGHMDMDLARYIFASTFGLAVGRSPKTNDFPNALAPNHRNWKSGKFSDRYRVQLGDKPATTITSHISKERLGRAGQCPSTARIKLPQPSTDAPPRPGRGIRPQHGSPDSR